MEREKSIVEMNKIELELNLQSKKPSDELLRNLDGGNTRVFIRSSWKVIDSTFDVSTATGAIKFETTAGKTYVEEWREGIRTRLFLLE